MQGTALSKDEVLQATLAPFFRLLSLSPDALSATA